MLAEILIPCFILACLLSLCLGYKQTPLDEPERKEYAMAALILFIAQALVTLFSLAWTGYFVFGAGWLAFTLLCHHAMIHRNSRFDGEPCSSSWFQLSDIRNHETWIVAAITAGWVSALRI